MRKKRFKQHHRYKKLILRGICLFFAGIIVNFAFLFSTDTLSWFTSARSACLHVKAATTADLIEKISVEERNPQEIRIKKAANYIGTSVLYFAIEGEALEYLAHLNPIKLDTHEEISVPLKPRVQLHQFFKLVNKKNNITGTLRIKYLNEFIDEEFSFTYTNRFLLDCFIQSLQDGLKDKMRGTRGTSLLKGQDELNSLLHYIVEQTGWEAISEILEEKRPLEVRINKPLIDSGSNGNSSELENDSYVEKENCANQDGLLDISDDIKTLEEEGSAEQEEVCVEIISEANEDKAEASEDRVSGEADVEILLPDYEESDNEPKVEPETSSSDDFNNKDDGDERLEDNM
jgi:hypothetical protein